MSDQNKLKTYKDILDYIHKLNPAQKISFAQKCGIVERKILSRDSSIDVQMAVLNSPKCSETEIESMASLGSTPELILKAIYTSPKWSKSLRVRLACLKNPRLPLSICNKFLVGLQKHQLRNISKQSDMPQKVVELAKKMLGKM